MQRATMVRLPADNQATESIGLFDLTRVKMNTGIGKSIFSSLVAGPEGLSGGVVGDRENPLFSPL
jgi:hypothetical protein